MQAYQTMKRVLRASLRLGQSDTTQDVSLLVKQKVEQKSLCDFYASANLIEAWTNEDHASKAMLIASVNALKHAMIAMIEDYSAGCLSHSSICQSSRAWPVEDILASLSSLSLRTASGLFSLAYREPRSPDSTLKRALNRLNHRRSLIHWWSTVHIWYWRMCAEDDCRKSAISGGETVARYKGTMPRCCLEPCLREVERVRKDSNGECPCRKLRSSSYSYCLAIFSCTWYTQEWILGFRGRVTVDFRWIIKSKRSPILRAGMNYSSIQ